MKGFRRNDRDVRGGYRSTAAPGGESAREHPVACSWVGAPPGVIPGEGLARANRGGSRPPVFGLFDPCLAGWRMAFALGRLRAYEHPNIHRRQNQAE